MFEIKLTYSVTVRTLLKHFIALRHWSIKASFRECVCMHCYVFLSDESLFTYALLCAP